MYRYNTMQHNTIQYDIMRYKTIQYNAIRHNTIQCDTKQYNTLQYRLQTLVSSASLRDYSPFFSLVTGGLMVSDLLRDSHVHDEFNYFVFLASAYRASSLLRGIHE